MLANVNLAGGLEVGMDIGQEKGKWMIDCRNDANNVRKLAKLTNNVAVYKLNVGKMLNQKEKFA